MEGQGTRSKRMKKRVSAKGPAAVVVVGSVTIDRIIENGKTSERLGGVITYGGLTFQRLGVETAVVTNVAEAQRGLLDVLAAEGLAVHAGKSRHTTRFVNEARGDWREQLMPEAADSITAGQVKPLLSEVRHVHAGPLHPDDIEPQAMTLMAESKKLVSLDVQGYLRRTENDRIVPNLSAGLEVALRSAHIIKADEEELTLMLDHYRAQPPRVPAALPDRRGRDHPGLARRERVDPRRRGISLRRRNGAPPRQHGRGRRRLLCRLPRRSCLPQA